MMGRRYLKLLLLCFLINRCSCKRVKYRKFAPYFVFGAATASYQIEGAWNVSDKSESIWDRYTHEYPERVFDHSNGDVATDSYHLFQEDVELLKTLGVDFYRFSISWPRLLPSGFSNKISEDGLRYYNDLIDELIKNDIKPVVTMYHWDLPQSLQDLGGWTNPLIVDYFVDYAEVLFKKFGDRVKAWITFNEPFSFCHDGYGGNDAPGGRSSGIEAYLCGHNVLKAHGLVYRLFENKYKDVQKSSLGITICMAWMEPATNKSTDVAAAERNIQFTFGWFAHPIFSKNGDYPPIMRKMIDEKSKLQNFPRSRLPQFTEEEIRIIKGSADFLGLNHYTTYAIKEGVEPIAKQPSFNNDVNVITTQQPDWPSSNSTWLKIVPWGFRKALNWIRVKYNNPPTIITENGISTTKGWNDTTRIAYIRGYLNALLDAHNDGCLVLGYTHWSLLDNFEWMRGYSERFGLFEVDYETKDRKRRPRSSAMYYATIIRTRTLIN